MRRLLLLVLAFMLLTACAPAIAPLSVEQQPVVAGVGVCHYVPGSAPDEFGWAYETSMGRGVFWRELETYEGQYDFSYLDHFIAGRVSGGIQVWLAFQTLGGDVTGVPKVSAWLTNLGAVWHTGACGNSGGMFAPWDPVYRERLALLLRAIGQHMAAWPQSYRDTVGGVVTMSGGMYGETQLWSCDMADHLKAHYGLTQGEMEQRFSQASREILDEYMAAFPGWLIMYQLGWPAVDTALADHAVNTYGDRVLLKWNGLDPTNVGDGLDHIRQDSVDFYVDLFNSLDVAAGFEIGHPGLLTGDAQYQNVMASALRGGVAFVCFQSPAWQKLMSILGWQEWDAALETNAQGPSTPTPTSQPPSTYQIGWYSDIWYPWTQPPTRPPSSSKLAGFANEGVSLVLSYNYTEYKTGAYLDEAERVGIAVMVEVPRKWTGRAGPLNLAKIRNLVTANMDHPALWGWYIGDEPEYAWDLSGQDPNHWGSPTTLQSIYQAIKSTGDRHPVALVHWARPRAEYVDAYDVLMNDWYPKDLKAGSQDVGEFNYMTRHSYGIWRQGLAFAAQNGKDGYIAVGWGQDYTNAVNPKPGMRDMTPLEFRYHTYTAIAQGVDGMLFWKEGWASPYVRGLVYDTTAELQNIGPAMVNGTTNVLTVSVPDDQLVHRYGSAPDAHVILAVNINGHSNAQNVNPDTVGQALQRVAFQLPYTARPSEIEVVGEGRTLPVTSHNTFVDDFDRYQAHIYRWPWGIVPTATPTPTSTPTARPQPTDTPTAIPTLPPTSTSTPAPTPTPTTEAIWILCDPYCRVVTPTP